MSRRAIAFWVMVVVLIVGFGVTLSDDAPSPRFDPTSTQMDGAHAFVTLLEEYGIETVDTLPAPDTNTTIVFRDLLAPEDRQYLQEWMESGGVLIVAEPISELVASPASGNEGWPRLSDPQTVVVSVEDCPFLSDRGLEPDAALSVAGVSFRAGAPGVDAAVCATGRSSGGGLGSATWMSAKPVGDGYLVSLADPTPFTNAYLGEEDNAVLAVALAAGTIDRERGTAVDTTVALLFRPTFFSDEPETVGDLIPSAAWLAGWQLIIAAAVYVWWRARRFGHPVLEPKPVDLPASLLVRSAAELRRNGHNHAPTVRVLARQVRDQLRLELGMNTFDSDFDLRLTLEDRDLSYFLIRDLFAEPPPVMTRDELVRLAQQHERVLMMVREQLQAGLAPAGASATDSADLVPPSRDTN